MAQQWRLVYDAPAVKTIEDRVRQISMWKRGGQRAPHKPLLLLVALARLLRGQPRLMTFAQVEETLVSLLRDFGPPRKSFHPEEPFCRLANDNALWELPNIDSIAHGANNNGAFSKSLLRKEHVEAGFPPALHQQLLADKARANSLVTQLLEDHFPSSMHDDILDAIGMPWIALRRRRDPAFRNMILRVYEHNCAVCGFDGRLGRDDVALEAAHLMWHAEGGPDSEDNGIALCVLHHKLLDRGAIGLDRQRRVLVSQHLIGGRSVHEHALRFAGKPLGRPQAGVPLVAEEHIAWHRREVFRGPARQRVHL